MQLKDIIQDGVTTIPANMFNLHELYIDGDAVSYVREGSDRLEVIAFHKYTNGAKNHYFLDQIGFNKFIASFR